jgi:hypothetical protein
VAKKVHNGEEWRKLLKTVRNRRILLMPMELMNIYSVLLKFDNINTVEPDVPIHRQSC